MTVVSAIAAFSACETNRVHLNDLGEKGAPPVEKSEYDRLRAQSAAAVG